MAAAFRPSQYPTRAVLGNCGDDCVTARHGALGIYVAI